MVDGASASNTAKTVTYYNNRKAQHDFYYMIAIYGDIVRGSMILPGSAIGDEGGTGYPKMRCDISWVNSANQQFWVEVSAQSSTSIKIQSSTNANGTLVFLYGVLKTY